MYILKDLRKEENLNMSMKTVVESCRKCCFHKAKKEGIHCTDTFNKYNIVKCTAISVYGYYVKETPCVNNNISLL